MFWLRHEWCADKKRKKGNQEIKKEYRAIARRELQEFNHPWRKLAKKASKKT